MKFFKDLVLTQVDILMMLTVGLSFLIASIDIIFAMKYLLFLIVGGIFLMLKNVVERRKK